MKEYLETKNDILSLIYLKKNNFRLYSYYILCILTFFIPAFIFNLKKNLKQYLYTKVESVDEADFVFLDIGDDERVLIEVKKMNLKIYEHLENEEYYVIKYQNIIFYFDLEKDCFMIFNSKFFDFLKKNVKDLKNIIKPISESFYKSKLEFFGQNNFRVKKIPLIYDVVNTFMQPLYMFYMFLAAIFVFSNEAGYLIVVGFSLIFMFAMKRSSYTNQIDKINAFSEKTPDCIVLKREKIINSNADEKEKGEDYKIVKKEINSRLLTQGDIIEIENKQMLNFDCLILTGECLINQSTLTGEATPILKTEIDLEKLKIKNVIYSGSEIIEVKTPKVYALILSVGFNSFQGNMISCLCHKKNTGITIKTDFLKIFTFFFGFFFCILTFKYYNDWNDGESIFFADIIFRYAQLLKDSFPIKAWLVLFVTDLASKQGLDEEKINKITTNHILLAGRIKLICFDKTGTLTQDNMKFYSYYKKEEEDFFYKRVIDEKLGTDVGFELMKNTEDMRFYELMGCCHSLMNLKDQVIGDPMEKEMFNLTNFDLIQEKLNNDKEEQKKDGENINIFLDQPLDKKNTKLIIKPKQEFLEKFGLDSDFKYEIKKYFHFDHDTKRMSVIIPHPKDKNKFIFLLKGAPEVVKNLCSKNTLPEDYNIMLEKLSKKGYRILTGAYKIIDNLDINIKDLEKDLNFCSLLVYENSLKEGVIESLASLKKCGYKTYMITGDALMTAISVGYKSNMLDNDKKIYLCKFNQKKKEFLIDKTDRDGLSVENLAESENQSAFNLYNNSILSEERQKIKVLVKTMIRDCEVNKNKIALDGNAITFLTEKFKPESKVRKSIFKHAVIYGRSNPNQKKLVVKELKDIYKSKNYYVGFVGDGANDGEALNEADVGFSVGNEFSSLVAGYYTESDKIEGIHSLSVEGKFALKNSIDISIYIIIYSFFRLCIIILLSYFNYNMISMDYWVRLVNEFFIIFALPYFLKSSKKKSVFMPEVSFLTRSIFTVIVFDIFTIFISVVVIILNLKFDEKYKYTRDIVDYDDKLDNDNYLFIESKVLVFLCFYTIPLLIWTFSTSYPFKKNVLTNTPLLVFSLILTFFFFSMFFQGYSIFNNYYMEYFKIKYLRWPNMQNNFNYKVLFMICIFMILVFLVNKCLVVYGLIKKGNYYQEKLKERISNRKEIEASNLNLGLK